MEIDDRVGGPCEVRSFARAEVRAPLAGFIREICVEQGDRVSPGTSLARLEIPDLESRLAQKRAQVREAEAELQLLEIGPRPEALAEQRRCAERAEAWRDLARNDLEQLRQAHAEELARLDEKTTECRAELNAARENFERAETLLAREAVSDEEYQEARRRVDVCTARLAQAEAETKSCRAGGTLEAEAELARREQALADCRSELALLEAGSRPEEIEAGRAHLARLEEEARYLEGLQEKLSLRSSISGIVTTERLREQKGRYVNEGDLICTVEEPATLQVEVALPEESIERIENGQLVRLKVRGYPYQTIRTRVDRIAPVAVANAVKPQQPTSLEVPKAVPVYCRVENDSTPLRSGMTGYARIHTGPRAIGEIIGDRGLRFVRTEFWW